MLLLKEVLIFSQDKRGGGWWSITFSNAEYFPG
jgi:hypothetical protein